MNRKEIAMTVCNPTGRDYKENYIEFCDLLLREDATEVFFGLFAVAVQDPYTNAFAWTAGSLLLDVNPMCPIACVNAIRAMLPNFDLSAEEVPYYLFLQFDRAVLDQALQQLRAEPLLSRHRISLDTVSYWFDVAESYDIKAKALTGMSRSEWCFRRETK